MNIYIYISQQYFALWHSDNKTPSRLSFITKAAEHEIMLSMRDRLVCTRPAHTVSAVFGFKSCLTLFTLCVPIAYLDNLLIYQSQVSVEPRLLSCSFHSPYFCLSLSLSLSRARVGLVGSLSRRGRLTRFLFHGTGPPGFQVRFEFWFSFETSTTASRATEAGESRKLTAGSFLLCVDYIIEEVL